MFQLEQASKCYAHKGAQVVALEPISLELAAGEFVAIIGPSGSGKTTLLSMLGGMLEPSAGKVWFDGLSMYDTSLPERAALRQLRIGFVFQSFNLIPYLTALENVTVPLMLGGSPSQKHVARATSLLSLVGLGDRLHHKPSELSVGQQQRVALARTLANDPAVVLADEPTGNLDPDTREQVLDFLTTLSREGRTVVVVTHDPAVASRAARTIKLTAGTVAADSARAIARVA